MFLAKERKYMHVKNQNNEPGVWTGYYDIWIQKSNLCSRLVVKIFGDTRMVVVEKFAPGIIASASSHYQVFSTLHLDEHFGPQS
uniref:Uncharacterized protein n=1 Tax=Romanomermis culicivorax TaxID=13658 RepID=A0A915L5B5_ROMCU